LLLLLLAIPVAVVHASTFLAAHPQVEMQSMPTQEVEQMLLAQFASSSPSASGGEKSDERVSRLASELAPLFAALPKNEEGKLDSAVVRYALNRYFAHKYGWHLRGLEPRGGTWNGSSPAMLMKDRAPVHIQGLLEERLQGHGMGLHELAIFAVILSDLVHREALADLEDIYSTMQISSSARLSPSALDSMLKMYLMLYIKGEHTKKDSPEDFRNMEEDLVDGTIAWPGAKLWVQDHRRGLDFSQGARRNPFVQEYAFEHVAEAVRELGHHFGAFQNLECQELKDRLVDMEHEGTGRVPLSKFYGGMDDQDWPFIESVDYLRNLGALDDRVPHKLSVIIPNFLSGPSNCVAPSSFYSVCCADECEPLLTRLELEIAGPSSPPGRLAEVVAALPSETVEAPRNLSAAQVARLEEIAAYHDGRVPLHGRLFAQWLHHAYPRECRFPHVAGSTSPLSQQEFTRAFGLDSEVSDEDLAFYVNRSQAEPLEASEALGLPWMPSEELITPHRGELSRGATTTASLRRFGAPLAALLSLGVLAVRTQRWRPLVSATTKQDKFLV